MVVVVVRAGLSIGSYGVLGTQATIARRPWWSVCSPRVFPLPVFATPIMSRPLMRIGSACVRGERRLRYETTTERRR